MKKAVTFLASTSVILALSAPAFAQTALTGVDALDDKITEIQDNVTDDLAKANDTERFSVAKLPQGFSGSLSASSSATSGNTDNRNLSIAGRMSYGTGAWNHSIGVAAEYGKEDGTTNKKQAYATYEANRYFSDSLYAFGTGRFQYDGFASNEQDAFIGFGPGFRIVNTENVSWRVQAGPGVRYTKDQAGNTATETSGILSSRLYYKLTDVMSITNDTDVLASKGSEIASNDFGINYKISDALSTRLSYQTDYNSKPEAGFEKMDNTFGASLVLGF